MESVDHLISSPNYVLFNSPYMSFNVCVVILSVMADQRRAYTNVSEVENLRKHSKCSFKIASYSAC